MPDYITVSNVWGDGPDAAYQQYRAGMLISIRDDIQGKSQKEIKKELGISYKKINHIFNGHLSRFTTEELEKMLRKTIAGWLNA